MFPFVWTNLKKRTNSFKRFFQTKFSNKIFRFLPDEKYNWTNDFTKPAILLILINNRSVRNRTKKMENVWWYKWTFIYRTNKFFFERLNDWKKSNKMGRSQTMKKTKWKKFIDEDFGEQLRALDFRIIPQNTAQFRAIPLWNPSRNKVNYNSAFK